MVKPKLYEYVGSLEIKENVGASHFLLFKRSIIFQTTQTIGVGHLRILCSHGILKGGMLPENVADRPSGKPIRSLLELKAWLDDTSTHSKTKFRSPDNLIIATFIIDRNGCLCLADRHSEHVTCAGGEAVLSAGEIFISVDRDTIRVTDITNQSTGYCPEPESWQQVAALLERIPIEHSSGFSVEFTFRRCTRCSQINIVKDDLFTCEVCGSTLPDEWNF